MKMLQANFLIIYIIHKILVLPKINRILQRFLRTSFFKKRISFFTTYNDEKFKA